jgi:hypothetical protein
MCSVPSISHAREGSSRIGTIASLEVTDGMTSVRGECFLVYQTWTSQEVTRYFLTVAHLVTGDAIRVRINVSDTGTIEIGPEDVLLPVANLAPASGPGWLDVAILRVRSSASLGALAAVPVVFEPIEPGQLLAIPLRDESGASLLALAGPVRLGTRWSVAPIIGDRPTTPDANLVGTPVLGPRGVVGLVTGWSDGGQTAFIASLHDAELFLRTQLAAWVPAAAGAPLFRVDTRHIDGPLVEVPGQSSITGEINVPLNLEPGEIAISARARLTNRRSIRLGEVTVLGLTDREIRLRFRLTGGEPPKAFPDPAWTPYPIGRALVTLEVDTVVVRWP